MNKDESYAAYWLRHLMLPLALKFYVWAERESNDLILIRQLGIDRAEWLSDEAKYQDMRAMRRIGKK